MKWWQSTTMNRLITASIRVRLWWRAPHIWTKTSWGNWSTDPLDWHMSSSSAICIWSDTSASIEPTLQSKSTQWTGIRRAVIWWSAPMTALSAYSIWTAMPLIYRRRSTAAMSSASAITPIQRSLRPDMKQKSGLSFTRLDIWTSNTRHSSTTMPVTRDRSGHLLFLRLKEEYIILHWPPPFPQHPSPLVSDQDSLSLCGLTLESLSPWCLTLESLSSWGFTLESLNPWGLTLESICLWGLNQESLIRPKPIGLSLESFSLTVISLFESLDIEFFEALF